MRDVIINLHSNAVQNKTTLKSLVINNTTTPDNNISTGEIVVINTPNKEGLYYLNNDGTDVIEHAALSYEEKNNIPTVVNIISTGTKVPTISVLDANDTTTDFANVSVSPAIGGVFVPKGGKIRITNVGSTGSYYKLNGVQTSMTGSVTIPITANGTLLIYLLT